MIAAMISTSIRRSKQARRWFPHGHFRKVPATFLSPSRCRPGTIWVPKSWLLFLPGCGMLPEIKFFSLDCTLRLAEPGFCLEAVGSSLFGRNTVRGRGEEQGIERRACLGLFPSSSTNGQGRMVHLYELHFSYLFNRNASFVGPVSG